MSDCRPFTNAELAKLSDSDLPSRGVFCPKCQKFIPTFESFDTEYERLLAQPRPALIRELRARTGCNQVFAKIWAAHPDGPHAAVIHPPCPFCGRPLFTERSKQCVQCGWDWHDAEHPVRHQTSVRDGKL